MYGACTHMISLSLASISPTELLEAAPTEATPSLVVSDRPCYHSRRSSSSKTQTKRQTWMSIYQARSLNTMRTLSILLPLFQPLAGRAVGLFPRAEACFITGGATLPRDVVVDNRVECDFSKNPFPGVPDVIFGDMKYSDVDFRTDQSVSPVGYALKNFKLPPDPTQGDLGRFEKLAAVYGATNAGLRSLGPRSRVALARLKGPAFFIDFQITRIKLDTHGRQGTAHKLGKVLKNCVKCTPAERQEVIALAASSGVDVAGKS